MARKRRLSKRYRRNPETSSSSASSPLLADLGELVLPGFGSFATARLLTRIVATQVAKKKPTWGKHAGALASIAAFFAAWWGGNKVKWLEKYQTPIMFGAGVAALQSVVQFYVPKLGWMVSDASPQLTEDQNLQLDDGSQQPLVAGVEYLDEDPNEYTYNDNFDPGVTAKPGAGSPKQAATEDEIINDLNMEDDELGDLHLGSLGRN